jgi:hypothetical protein
MSTRRAVLVSLAAMGLIPATAGAAKAPLCGGCNGNGQCESGYCVNGFCAGSPTPCQIGYKCRTSFTCKSGVPTCCGSKRCAKRNAGGRCVVA